MSPIVTPSYRAKSSFRFPILSKPSSPIVFLLLQSQYLSCCPSYKANSSYCVPFLTELFPSIVFSLLQSQLILSCSPSYRAKFSYRFPLLTVPIPPIVFPLLQSQVLLLFLSLTEPILLSLFSPYRAKSSYHVYPLIATPMPSDYFFFLVSNSDIHAHFSLAQFCSNVG